MNIEALAMWLDEKSLHTRDSMYAYLAYQIRTDHANNERLKWLLQLMRREDDSAWSCPDRDFFLKPAGKFLNLIKESLNEPKYREGKRKRE